MKKLKDFGPLDLTNPSQIGFRLGELARAGQLTAKMLDGLEGNGVVEVDKVFKGFLLAESQQRRAYLLRQQYREEELPVEKSLGVLTDSLALEDRAKLTFNEAADALIGLARRGEKVGYPIQVNLRPVVQQVSQPRRKSFGRLRSR